MKFFNFLTKSKQPKPPPPDLSIGSTLEATSYPNLASLEELEDEPPMQCPFADLNMAPKDWKASARCPFHSHMPILKTQLTTPVPLVVERSTHQVSDGTAALLADIGGGDRIREACTRFYARAFEDKVLKQFFFEFDGASEHGQRLADWVIEKMGGEGKPWTDSGRFGGRQAAHHQAWNSFKRHQTVKGDHFQLDDVRIWMRLHFWSVRETGLDQHKPFMNWYIQFIKHFIAVYERKAPVYTEESAEWSLSEENIALYKQNNNYMADVILQPIRPGYGPDA